MLNQLKYDENKESIGLYRDDGLGVFHNIPKPEIERKKKQIVIKIQRMWIIYRNSVQLEISGLLRRYF